jgi:hypothetical protein
MAWGAVLWLTTARESCVASDALQDVYLFFLWLKLCTCMYVLRAVSSLLPRWIWRTLGFGDQRSLSVHVTCRRGCALPTATVPPTGADMLLNGTIKYGSTGKKRFIPLMPQPHISYTISPGFSQIWRVRWCSWYLGSLEQYGTTVACSRGRGISATQG